MSRRNIKIAKQLVRLAKELAASVKQAKSFTAGGDKQKKELDDLWNIIDNWNNMTILQDLQKYIDDLQNIRAGKSRIYNEFIQKKINQRDQLILEADRIGERAKLKESGFSLNTLQGAEAFASGLLALHYDTNSSGELLYPDKESTGDHPGVDLRKPIRFNGYSWDKGATNRVTGLPGSWIKPLDSTGEPMENADSNPRYNIGLFMLRQEKLASQFQAFGSLAFANNASFNDDYQFHRVPVPIKRANLFMSFGKTPSDKEQAEMYRQLALLARKHRNLSEQISAEVASSATCYKIHMLLLNAENEVIACHDTWDLGLKKLHELGVLVLNWRDKAEEQLADPKMSGIMQKVYPNGTRPLDEPTIVTKASCYASGRRMRMMSARMRQAGMFDWIPDSVRNWASKVFDWVKKKVSVVWKKMTDKWDELVDAFEVFETNINNYFNQYKVLLKKYIAESNREEEAMREEIEELDRFIQDIYDAVMNSKLNNNNDGLDLDDESL